mgnify:CR=1 FL=1
MPSSRKRIGFLPKSEIQDLINILCENTNCSQSKVTGFLVEEALIARGLLENNDSLEKNKDINKTSIIKDSKEVNFEDISKPTNSKVRISDLIKNENSQAVEYETLKDYIEYKRFKQMLRTIKAEGSD